MTVAEQYLRKASTVYLKGQFETRKWQDQSGADKYTTDIILRLFRSKMTMLGSVAIRTSRPNQTRVAATAMTRAVGRRAQHGLRR